MPIRGTGPKLIATALVAVLAAAACGSDNSGTSTATTAATPTSGAATTAAAQTESCDASKVGGNVTFGVYSETRGLDPVVAAGGGTAGQTELTALYDTLMRYNPDTSEFEPWLAQSLQPNADFTVWTLKLRPNVKFGSGNPLTADAVKTSIARHQDPNNRASAYQDTLQIADMRVVDPTTLEFTLKEAWGTFPALLADMPGMIIDPAVLAQMGKDAFNTNPHGAGAGPYEVTSFKPGEEIVYTAKPDYWGGPVCIQQIKFVHVATDKATYDALKLGEVDVAFLRDPQVVADAKADGVEHHSEVVYLGNFLMINSGFNSAVAADERIRLAAAHAVDQTVVDQRSFGGKGLPSSAIVTKDSAISPGIDGPAVDTTLASKLVADAKAAGWNGKISLVCGSATPDTGITIQAQLQAVGFDVTLEQLATPDLVKRVFVDRNYDFACSGAGVSVASPAVRLARFFGTGNALTGFANPQFDEALRALKKASTADEMKQAMTTVQQIWNDTAPSIGLSAVENTIAWNDRVHGLVFNENYSFYFAKAYVTNK